MSTQQSYDNKNPSLNKDEVIARLEIFQNETIEIQRDLATEEAFGTQHSDGHTYNPHLASEQGLTYTPPYDPPVLPSDNLQGAKVNAGFAPTIEMAGLNARKYPQQVEKSDLDLQQDILLALRAKAQTANMADQIAVHVSDGIVTLFGRVQIFEDIGRVADIVYEIKGVRDVLNQLELD